MWKCEGGLEGLYGGVWHRFGGVEAKLAVPQVEVEAGVWGGWAGVGGRLGLGGGQAMLAEEIYEQTGACVDRRGARPAAKTAEAVLGR